MRGHYHERASDAAEVSARWFASSATAWPGVRSRASAQATVEGGAHEARHPTVALDAHRVGLEPHGAARGAAHPIEPAQRAAHRDALDAARERAPEGLA